MRACIERDDSVGVGTFYARGSIRVCSFSFPPFFLSYLFLLFILYLFNVNILLCSESLIFELLCFCCCRCCNCSFAFLYQALTAITSCNLHTKL